MTVDRRVFSFGPLLGWGQSRTLNPDASYSSYSGLDYGLEANFHVISLQETGLHFFGRYVIQDQKGKTNSTDKFKNTQTLFGLKAFVGKQFYLGLGYGDHQSQFTNPSTEYTVSNGGPALGAGAEFKLSTSFYLGLNAWYSNHPLKNEAPLLANSFSENGIFYLSLLWSPAEVSILDKSSSSR